ncbi:hypothetical protein AMATHDRAFT_141771 [Amanita thiersii Skay4041]|uniref:Uncharacterized protein n=1 Tax=Amanita thiersii Skay4041 TaxID=703135 RepID=A0A2A9NVQ2_9AGAR|nr:hypothetical protein AMATHDRAFT_141771 [Amanita thiersii Skay4041]
MDNHDAEDPEEILSSSLETLYDYKPITWVAAKTPFTYKPNGAAFQITLDVPDTKPGNWSLHASDIWMSSIHLADHLHKLQLEDHICSLPPNSQLRVLELGAAAGLPGILIARSYPDIAVTLSDYPDERLLRTLTNNVHRNVVTSNCRVVGHSWGSQNSSLLGTPEGFDIVIAADTLWNPALHHSFIDTLRLSLRQSPSSRIHIVAGLHTGRYAIQSFLRLLTVNGFQIESLTEREAQGQKQRDWQVVREHEDERERRGWVIWIKVKWLRDFQIS